MNRDGLMTCIIHVVYAGNGVWSPERDTSLAHKAFFVSLGATTDKSLVLSAKTLKNVSICLLIVQFCLTILKLVNAGMNKNIQ